MAPQALAWRIPWLEEPGGLQSMGLLGVKTGLSDFTFTFHFHALKKEMATHSSVLAWIIPGSGEPGGLPSLGLHRVRHDWSDLTAAAAALAILYILMYRCQSQSPSSSHLPSPHGIHMFFTVKNLMWKWKSLSRVWLFATPWTIQSMEFSRPECWSTFTSWATREAQEYWSG